MSGPQTPLAQVHVLYERAEAGAASLAERVVGSDAFGELLATTATTAMTLAGLLNTTLDRAVRATRVAARVDLVALGRQLGRTEDKLEHLLQAVEELSERLDAAEPRPRTRRPG